MPSLQPQNRFRGVGGKVSSRSNLCSETIREMWGLLVQPVASGGYRFAFSFQSYKATSGIWKWNLAPKWPLAGRGYSRIGNHYPSRVLPTPPFEAMITHIWGCSNSEAPIVSMTSNIQRSHEPRRSLEAGTEALGRN